MNTKDSMRKLAERGHKGQFRKDGKTPYIEHPRAVVALLERWGVSDDVTLGIAWGHDLLEDTAVTEAEIRRAAGALHADEILEGIRSLTRDKTVWPDKTAWLREVARTAGEKALLVKAADRICNTRDFLALGTAAHAKEYLAQAAPVFALAPLPETIAKELEAVRAEIDEALAKQPTPAGTGITELYFVLDRSGSMTDLVPATISGFKEMLEKQKRIAKGELFVSTLLFDDRNDVLHSHVPVAEMLPLTTAEYTIGGCTALLDAVGDAIQHAVHHQRHAKPERRAENVVFVIITDGLENASRRFTNRQVQEMVARETKDYGWEFLYLGANIDAFAAAADIGIDKSHAANWVADASGIGTTFKDIGDAVCCMRESNPAAPYSLSSGAWKKRTDEDYRKRGKGR